MTDSNVRELRTKASPVNTSKSISSKQQIANQNHIIIRNRRNKILACSNLMITSRGGILYIYGVTNTGRRVPSVPVTQDILRDIVMRGGYSIKMQHVSRTQADSVVAILNSVKSAKG